MDKCRGSPRVLTKSIDKEYWPRVLAESTSHISTMAGPIRLKFFLQDSGAQRAPRCGRRPPDMVVGHKPSAGAGRKPAEQAEILV